MLPRTPAARLADANRIVNLDAGGGRRWGDGDLDFGEEPEEDGAAQVWSCEHNFETFTPPPEDGFNRGNFDKMECNRCFDHVKAQKEVPKLGSSKKRRLGNGKRASLFEQIFEQGSQDESQIVVSPGEQAHECKRCKIVVCMRCKERFEREGDDSRAHLP